MRQHLLIDYSPKSHIPALDGLRGLAIVMVLLYHCFPNLYKVGTGIGWIGVDLFFVLSGFLITGILVDSKHNADYLKHFFFRRALRIFPLYYLFLAGFFFLLPLVAPSTWKTDYAFYYTHQAWYWAYLPNILISLQNHWPPVSKPILDHFWSLAIEEQFYLFWPFLVMWLTPRKLLYLSLYLIIQSLLIRNIFVSQGLSYSTSYVFTFARLDAICTGATIALCMRDEKLKSLLAQHATSILVGMGGIILAIIALSRSLSLKEEYFIRFGYTAIALFFGAALVHALSKGHFLQTFTQSQLLRWFGKYSYGIYVYHWFLYPILADYLIGLLSASLPPLLVGFTSSIICTGIIIGCALSSWNLIEKHFLRLKNWV